MKKIFVVVLAILVALFSVGCSTTTVMDQSDINSEETTFSTFVLVEKTGSWKIVYDRDTLCMYAVSNGGYSYGNFTLLVNSDGTPKLWEGK